MWRNLIDNTESNPLVRSLIEQNENKNPLVRSLIEQNDSSSPLVRSLADYPFSAYLPLSGIIIILQCTVITRKLWSKKSTFRLVIVQRTRMQLCIVNRHIPLYRWFNNLLLWFLLCYNILCTLVLINCRFHILYFSDYHCTWVRGYPHSMIHARIRL